MNKELAYEFIEEADKREIMEILDAAVNRFWELHDDWDLMLITLPKGEGRQETLEKTIEKLRQMQSGDIESCVDMSF